MAKLPNNQQNHVVTLEERRTIVAKMYLQGATQPEISRVLRVSQPTVSLDLKAVRAEWLANRIDDYGERIDAELARLEHLEYQAWQAFERSTQVFDDNGKLLPRKAPGNPAWLERVAWCIDTRLKLFGLYKQPDENKTQNNFFVQWERLYERQPITDPLEAELEALEHSSAAKRSGRVPDEVQRSLEANTAKVVPRNGVKRTELIEAERQGNVIVPKATGAPAKPKANTNKLPRTHRNGG